MEFQHFIITRFNLKNTLHKWEKDKNGEAVLTDSWMEERLDVFLKYCLPSVCSQDSQNFKWLIYIDIDTEDKYKNKFKELSEDFDFITVKQVASYQAFQNNYCSNILDLIGNDSSHVITTRLDNDDILHKGYINKVQSLFKHQEYMAINFLKVLMLHPLNKRKLHIDYQFSNHFISLIEQIKEEGIKGCYLKGDKYWNIRGEVIQVTDKPYCIETISNQNLVNDFRGFPVLRQKWFSDFSLKGAYRNSFKDIDNIKIWKMSWKKYSQYLKLSLSKSNNQ